jgi:hypothetical protein
VDGQILKGSFTDYTMPLADDLPSFVVGLNEVPAKTNPLGVKGTGEAGCVGAPPAVINAVLDSLRPLGVTDLDMPAAAAGLERNRRGGDGVLCKAQELFWQVELWDVREILGLITNLVGIAQRGALQSVAQWLNDNGSLSLLEHHAPHASHTLAPHGVADHGIGFLANLISRRDVVGRVEIARIDLRARHEPLNLNGPGVLNTYRSQRLRKRRGASGHESGARFVESEVKRAEEISNGVFLLFYGRRCTASG